MKNVFAYLPSDAETHMNIATPYLHKNRYCVLKIRYQTYWRLRNVTGLENTAWWVNWYVVFSRNAIRGIKCERMMMLGHLAWLTVRHCHGRSRMYTADNKGKGKAILYSAGEALRAAGVWGCQNV